MSDIQKGDQFLVMDDIEALGATHWAAAFTGGFKSIVPKGTVLIVKINPPSEAKGFVCLPKNYKEFELKFVPEEDRKTGGYSGFSLVVFKELIGSGLQKLSLFF